MIKSTTLKKLYPDLWDSVHDQIYSEMVTKAESIASSAAASVCGAYHIKMAVEKKSAKTEKE